MRYRFFIFSLAGIFLTLTSCNVLNLSQNQDKEEPGVDSTINLTEQDQLKYEYAFVEGVKQKLMGNVNKALGFFYKCIEIDKNAAAPRYEISQINTMMGEDDVAIRYAKKAIQYDPGNKWYREHLAKLYIQNKNYASAIGQYEKIIENGNQNLDYYFTLAQLYQETGKYNKSLDNLNTIEKRTGVNEQLAMMKRSLYMKMGKKKEAVEEIQRLVENFPNETRYYGMLAELYAQLQDFDKAEQMYDKLFSIDSTNNLGQISKIRYFEQAGKTDEAIDLFISSITNEKIDYGTKLLIFMNFLENKNTVTRHTDHLKKSLDSLSAHYPEKYENRTLYADFYLKTGNYKKAIEELEYLVHSSKSQYIFYDQLASLYSLTGNFRKMYEIGREGLRKYDSKPRLYLLTAMGAIQQDNIDQAIKLLKDGLVYIKNDQQLLVDFYVQLAEAHHQIQAYSKSDYYFEKVLNIDPNNVLVLNNYSYYLSLRDSKLEKAQKMSKKTIEEEPRSAIYLDTYAWILFKQKKYEKALEYIEKAIRYGGHDDSDVVEHYGDILYKNGKKMKAIEQWKKARTLGGKSDALLKKIESKKLVGEN